MIGRPPSSMIKLGATHYKLVVATAPSLPQKMVSTCQQNSMRPLCIHEECKSDPKALYISDKQRGWRPVSDAKLWKGTCSYSTVTIDGKVRCEAGQSDTSKGGIPRFTLQEPPLYPSFLCTQEIAGCPFSELTVPSGASVSGTNCHANTTIPHGGSCNFEKQGFKCERATCCNGRFSKATCSRPGCKFSKVIVPGGANVTGVGCNKGSEVKSGSQCVLTKPRHDCETISCKFGRFSSKYPACTPKACLPSSLTIPRGAHSNCSIQTRTNSTVEHGTVCAVYKHGFKCETSMCDQGAFKITSPKCEEKGCLFNTVKAPADVDKGFSHVNCVAGKKVPHGTKCFFSKNAMNCESVTCNKGNFSSLSPRCVPQTCCQQQLQSPFGLEVPEDSFLLKVARATSKEDTKREKAAKLDFKQGHKNRIVRVKEIIDKVVFRASDPC